MRIASPSLRRVSGLAGDLPFQDVFGSGGNARLTRSESFSATLLTSEGSFRRLAMLLVAFALPSLTLLSKAAAAEDEVGGVCAPALGEDEREEGVRKERRLRPRGWPADFPPSAAAWALLPLLLPLFASVL